jgi:hypothetical protein
MVDKYYFYTQYVLFLNYSNTIYFWLPFRDFIENQNQKPNSTKKYYGHFSTEKVAESRQK